MKQLNINKGVTALRTSSTWKRVGGVALGSLVAGIGASVIKKVAPDSVGSAGKFAGGTCIAGIISIGCFAMGYENAGVGSAMITVNQALNTATLLIMDKSIAELTS